MVWFAIESARGQEGKVIRLDVLKGNLLANFFTKWQDFKKSIQSLCTIRAPAIPTMRFMNLFCDVLTTILH
ncbi:hypothetical protein K070079E91_25180 [Eisenbergiella porci]